MADPQDVVRPRHFCPAGVPPQTDRFAPLFA